MSNSKRKNFGKYTFEFILIFVSVLLAFALTNIRQNKDQKISETKILTEIRNGLAIDEKDFQANIEHYHISLDGIKSFRQWVDRKEFNQDSIAVQYYILFRNFAPIMNKAGYESLKNSNLKTIKNDSLRLKIIELYEYHYKIIDVLENDADEFQDFKNYFKSFNDILHPYMIFEDGDLKGLLPQNNLTDSQKSELMSYLWRMKLAKKFKLTRYERVMENLKKLEDAIDIEIGER